MPLFHILLNCLFIILAIIYHVCGTMPWFIFIIVHYKTPMVVAIYSLMRGVPHLFLGMLIEEFCCWKNCKACAISDLETKNYFFYLIMLGIFHISLPILGEIMLVIGLYRFVFWLHPITLVAYSFVYLMWKNVRCSAGLEWRIYLLLIESYLCAHVWHWAA